MKESGNEDNGSLSKNKSEQDQWEAKRQGGDSMEIEEVAVTDRAAALSLENGTAVNVHVFNVSYYHLSDVFLRIEQIGDLDIPLCDASLL